MSHRFILKHQVTKEHLDDLNHVNNVQYLYWAQEIAKAHWQKIKPLISKPSAVWMVRNHEVTYKLGAFLGDTIRVETHVKEVRGPLSTRVVEFFDDNSNQLLVRCKTQWCFIDPVIRKPLRIHATIKDCFLNSQSPFEN
jgi:acyl-CoA thioester hydrolase